MSYLRLLGLLATWLGVSWSTLQHGPSQAPCSYAALTLVLALWAIGNMCRDRCKTSHAIQVLLYILVLVIMHFAEEFARLQTLQKPGRPELFERRECILCAVLDEDELLPVFDVLVGASLLSAVVLLSNWLLPLDEGSVRSRCLPVQIRTAAALWALAEAIQCSCYPFNFMAGKPHNLDRTIVMVLGILTIILPGLGWWFVPWCILMTSQFSWNIADGSNMTDANARPVLWGIMWQLLLALEAWQLVAVFFPSLEPDWAEAMLRMLLGTHYFTAWAHKYACGWLKMYNEAGSEAIHLWHWFASGSYAFGTDQALGLLTAIPFRFTVDLGRKCEWLMAASAVCGQLACGVGLVMFPGRGACLCALMQLAFHIVVSVQSGHVFWGHALACVGIAFLQLAWKGTPPRKCTCDHSGKKQITNGSKKNKPANERLAETSLKMEPAMKIRNANPFKVFSLLYGSQILAFAFYNAFNVGHILRYRYVGDKLLTASQSWDPAFLRQPLLMLAFLSQCWPLEPYGGFHPALPTMAFVPSVGVNDWRIHLQFPDGQKLEMDAYAFTPFATTFARSDPSFLHEFFSALPWSRDGATGSPGFAAVGARSAVHECSKMMPGEDGEWLLPIPGWARCIPRQLWTPTDEKLEKDIAVRQRFKSFVGRSILHLSGSSARFALLAPFRFLDLMYKEGWWRPLPREPWCCHGQRSGDQLSSISMALTRAAELSNDSLAIHMTVTLSEAMMCEDERLPGGFQHVSGFNGVVYNADFRLWTGSKADNDERFSFKRSSAPELESEVARCNQQASLLHATVAGTARGNPECWSDGFDFNTCCAPDFGPKGNLQCWDSTFTFERCCEE